jgi:hypothetical protein
MQLHLERSLVLFQLDPLAESTACEAATGD